MSFVQRQLSFSFTLGGSSVGASSTFAGTNSNTVTVGGLRASVTIDNMVSRYYTGQANIRIFGLPLSTLNALSQLQRLPTGNIQLKVPPDQITIKAGDAGSQLSTVYQGIILTSRIDLNGMPDSVLDITANGGGAAATQSTPTASSFAGRQDVMQILQSLCSQCSPPLTLENSTNAAIFLTDEYLRGSILDQLQQAIYDAGLVCVIERNILAVWPRGSSRQKGGLPTLSPATGMIGYPTNDGINLMVRHQFLPNIYMGQQVALADTALSFANGTWTVMHVEHELSSEMPDGPWFTNLRLLALQS